MRFDSQLSRMDCQTFSPFDRLRRVQFRAFRRPRQQRDVLWHNEGRGAVPSGLIEQQHGMRAWRHGGRDFREVKRHALGVAAGQDERRPPFDKLRTCLAFGRTDRAIDAG